MTDIKKQYYILILVDIYWPYCTEVVLYLICTISTVADYYQMTILNAEKATVLNCNNIDSYTF